MNEEFNINHTFCPKTNVDKNKLGDLDQFLDYQTKHVKKVTEKVSKLIYLRNLKKFLTRR